MEILYVSYAIMCITGTFHLLLLIAYLLGYTPPEFFRVCKFRALAEWVEDGKLSVVVLVLLMLTFYIPKFNIITGGIYIIGLIIVFLTNAMIDIHNYMRDRRKNKFRLSYKGK